MNNSENPLDCPKCNGSLKIDFSVYTYFGSYSYIEKEKTVRIGDAPIWRCTDCGYYRPDDETLRFGQRLITEKAITGRMALMKAPEEVPVANYTSVNFFADARDYFLIPGLIRPWNDFFLTPIFFKHGVLLKYLNDPTYLVDFSSSTYGSIRTSDWQISFGVNRSGRVIMWLGDIADLPQQEQYYLMSECITSDHDIASDFYLGQIGVVFTAIDDEPLLLLSRSSIAIKVFDKISIRLYKMEQEVQDMLTHVHAPVLYTEKELETAYSALNKVFVESLDIDALSTDIYRVNPTWPAKGKKQLKHFEEWLNSRLSIDGRTISTPLFVLYDLRVAHSHLTSINNKKELISSCRDRLGLSSTIEDAATIYRTLINQLNKSLQSILDTVERLP